MIGSIIFCALVIAFLLRLYKDQSQAVKLFFWPGLIMKLAFGIALGLVYTYYYSVGDTFGFFNDAQTLTGLAKSNPIEYLNFLWQGDDSFAFASTLSNVQVRSLFLVKVLSLVTLVSFENYWVSSLYFSLVSFLGSWYLVVKLGTCFPKGRLVAIISFLFIPSCLFWSSGIVKESLAIGALLFLSGYFVGLIQNQKLIWWEWTMALISLILLWNLKYYWAALFIPSALTTFLIIRIETRLKLNKALETILWIGIFCGITLLASNIHPNFYLSRFLTVIVENNDAYTTVSENSLIIRYHDLEPSWISIFINSPWALISGLFRPFIFESNTIFQTVISFENLVLLVLCVLNIRHMVSAWNSKQRLLILSAVVYILLLTIFLSLSTPNFGTLSRYRIGFLPHLFFLLLYNPCQLLYNRINKLK